MQEVVVIGSANLDIVVPIQRYPKVGETLIGGQLARHPGGKGANQAVAASRAGGGAVHFIGAVGRDRDADLLISSLSQANCDLRHLQQLSAPTGVALIWVLPDGGNTIVVAPGANQVWNLDSDALRAISNAAVVLAQLEVPLELVQEAARVTQGLFILNAAPSQALPQDLLDHVDVLIVNEYEGQDIVGECEDMVALTRSLMKLVPRVVLTLGSKGLIIGESGAEPVELKPYQVHSVDSTGAGDTFCGVLAARLALGDSLRSAAQFASAAGALSTTKEGAQESIPTEEEVFALTQTHSAC